MQLFKKKKLTLREIHELYLLLKPCLPEKEEAYLLDEVDKMLNKMTEEILKQSLLIIYKKEFKEDSFALLSRLMQGLINNLFFDYVHFLNGIK